MTNRMFFFSHLKLNMSETRKSKMKILYIYTAKNVSTASHKLPHFLSEHASTVKKIKHRKFGADRLIFMETRREKLGGE